MPVDDLRTLFPLIDSNAAFGDYPDGVTWADLEEAERLKATETALETEAAPLRAEGWTDAR